MTIELKIVANDANDLRRQLTELLGEPVTEVTYEVTPKAPAPKAEKPPKADPKPQAEAPKAEEPAPPAAETEAQPEAQVDGLLTYDGHIKPAVLKVSAKHGRPGVEKLLADFNVGNAKEIPEARWPELLTAIDALLEA